MPHKDPKARTAYKKEWRAKNRARALATDAKWRERNRPKVREYFKAWTTANPDKATSYLRRYRLKKNYGLSEERYLEMLAAQDEKCACCGDGSFFVKSGHLFVDHDHGTGQIRGLLCRNCNSGIAYLGDSLEGVERARTYLRRQSSASGATGP